MNGEQMAIGLSYPDYFEAYPRRVTPENICSARFGNGEFGVCVGE